MFSVFRVLSVLMILCSSVFAQTVYFEENFENATPSMTITGGGWEYGTPTTPSTVPEGNRCAGTVINGNYSNYAEYILTSPSISLPDSNVIKLSFYEWYETESSYDYIYLEIEKDGSGTWSAVRSISGYNTTWNLKAFDISSYRNSSIKIRFRFTSDRSSVYQGWYIDNIRFFTPEIKTLNVTNDGNGTTTPSGSTLIETNSPYSILASPTTGYRFDKWTVESGNVNITDTFAYSTDVYITNDAVIKANFKPCSVYTITPTETQYNYTTHYYENNPSSGVRFKFIAPDSGAYSVSTQNIQSHYNYFYFYGNDSTFSSYTDYKYSSASEKTISFHAENPGDIFYFRVYTSSSYYSNDFNISYSDALTLNIANDGNGTTNPSGIIGMVSGESRSITASPNSGYRFENWSIISGSPAISDTNATITSISITSDAAIQANFTPGTVYDLDSVPTVYNFESNYFEINPTNGVRFRFSAPDSGTYTIVIDSSYKHMYYYSTDSTFSSYTGTVTYNDSVILYSFTASSAGECHYFIVKPYSQTYYNDNFYASVCTPSTLIITTNGNGIIVPFADTMEVYPGYPYTFTAVPKGGYQFSTWNLISGQATFSKTDSSVTNVIVSGDTAAIEASFQIDPNTIPYVNISDINISSHPDICITASVEDSSGRSISGLDSSNFVLSQDNDTVDFQLTTVSNVTGVSVALVIDRSGSMSGQDIIDAKNAARLFVQSMSPLDRCAIVSFESTARVDQVTTSDTTLLNAAIGNINASGGTYILNGTVMGIEQLVQETNTKAVIVFSDGVSGTESIFQQVVDSARNNNITIYSIGIGASADRSVLGALADSTGGYYSEAPTAAGLAQLYAQIKSDVESQYILCYQSPDIVFNGDTHEVVLTANLNSYTDNDTVYWDENNSPPSITLTTETQAKIGVSQTANQPLTISANVIDDGSINSVRLFYRISNITTGPYTEIPMPLSSGTLYEAVISAGDVIFPGIDFYILASDNYNLIGRSPNVLAPENQPYVIPVDNQVPEVNHTAFDCVILGQDTSISAIITDNDGTFTAILYHKKGNETFFSADTMIETSPDLYSSTIQGNRITNTGIDYYIRAVDSVGAATRFPQQGYISLPICSIENYPPVADAGGNQTFYIEDSCTIEVTLDGSGSYDPDNDPLTYSWTNYNGTNISGKIYLDTLIPGSYKYLLTVTDGRGLSDCDSVTITVLDTIKPVPDLISLPDINAQCDTALTPPTAGDNCDGIIDGATTDPLVYNNQGTYTVHWEYVDSYGNTSNQLQTIIVKDTTAPTLSIPSDTTLIISNFLDSVIIVTDSAEAVDNCSPVTLTAERNDGLSLNSHFFPGTTLITWAAYDTNGNCDSAIQTIEVIKNHAPVLSVPDDTSMHEGEALSFLITASDSDGTTPQIILSDTLVMCTFKDSSNGKALLTFAPGCVDHGLDTIIIHAIDGIDTVTSQFQMKIHDIDFPPEIDSIGYQTARKGQPFSLTVNVYDCDLTIPSITLLRPPSGASFVDNNDGTGTFTWTPDKDNYGYYVLVFEASDGNSTVRDTTVLEVVDDNIYEPVLELSDTIVNTSINLPVTILATATDEDGKPPVLNTSDLPENASFKSDSNGTAVFSWTPEDTGSFSFDITATDFFDSTMEITVNVTITVNGENITGPVFLSRADTSILQNSEMRLHVEAHDQDGTIPELFFIKGPAGIEFKDNGDGTGTVIWIPQCDESGSFTIKVGAKDESLADTLSTGITVQDVNCTPVIDHIPDVNADPGQMITIPVSAYDPDNNGTIPVLSASCVLEGFVFITSEDGTGEFRCPVPADSGVYSVTFYATDGVSSDSTEVKIAVNKHGSISIKGNVKGARIYVLPSGSFKGTYLGTDSVKAKLPQGAYWFEISARGYRTERIFCKVESDTMVNCNAELKPSIPLMLTGPDTLSFSTDSIAQPEMFSFIDLNKDGIEDLVILSKDGASWYAGLDSLHNIKYRKQISNQFNAIAGYKPVYHQFIDWDNDGTYDHFFSDQSGEIIVINRRNSSVTKLITRDSDEKLYPVVIDIDNNGKRDVLVHSENRGLYLYKNQGTDTVPVYDFAQECTDSSGHSFTDFAGAPVLADLDNDGTLEFIVISDSLVCIYTPDSLFSTLSFQENLNCAGKRFRADNTFINLIGSPSGLPKIVLNKNDTILLYPTHLLGDINSDSVVNIKDISTISKQMEYSEDDKKYNPILNLRLSKSGKEIIDIRDISKASKCWELQQ